MSSPGDFRSPTAADALASLADHVAILDSLGNIVAVNSAWNAFGVARGVENLGLIGPSVNYLEICAKAARNGIRSAARALEGIEDVCRGRRQLFELEYQCNGPFEAAWFLMNVTPFRHPDGGVVVSHRNITAYRGTGVARARSVARLTGIKMRQLSGRLVGAQEEERRRIARDLHDDLNQRLALLAIGIEQAGLLSPDHETRTRLQDLWHEATEISTRVHNISHELHSSTLGLLGLAPALRTLGRQLAAKGLAVTVLADDLPTAPPPPVSLCLFRVAQEALANVVKHSGTNEATVTLRENPAGLRLHIEDRGRGFDPAAARGLGLLSMRERLALEGGLLIVRTHPGEGTRVEARISRERRRSSASKPTPFFAA